MIIQTASPKVSILMAIIDNFALADQCIMSVFRYTDEPFFLLLGDNGTGVKGQEYFTKWGHLPNTKIIRSDTLIAHGEVIDYLLKYVLTPFFVLMDSDTEILRKTWLNEMISGFKNDPKILEVGSDLIEHRDNYFAPMDKLYVRQLERFGPWLLMFRREVTDICPDISFAFHKEWIEKDGVAKYSYWDTGSRIHFALMDNGYKYYILPKDFSRNFIHYGKVRWRKNANGLAFSVFSFFRRSVRRWFGRLKGADYLAEMARKLGVYD
jgi:cellulose synthase/poly-beta-1,6-N-acetylglucosamine synthase-like glycosyltransferase